MEQVVGVKGLQNILETTNTEVNRCASSALALFVGSASNNPMMVGGSAPVMLRMTLGHIHSILQPTLSNKHRNAQPEGGRRNLVSANRGMRLICNP